ncbi:MAG: hypothetical protein EAZ11_12285 [Curvibacter sp.]|nr:MAG: hypothetical protein EAZ11_12285 [Curvibacter sp.]
METHTLSERHACNYLSKFRLVDPLGRETLAEAVRGAWCLRLISDKGSMVLCVKSVNGRLWIAAAGAESRQSMTADVLAWAMEKARQWRAVGVGFQTARPGLVRRACALGYVARPCGNGWTLEKNNEIL